LSRNNAVAKSYLKILLSNVVGERGITYRSLVRNNDQNLNQPSNTKIEKAWREWSKKGNCTVDRRFSLRQVQNLILKTLATDGEVFIRLVPGFANKYRFALQMIDADQVDHLFSRAKSPKENEIRLGIEVDEWVHLFDPEHVNQTRGITWFHPCMVEMRMLGGYVEAELVAARAGAAKMGFLKYTDPSAFEAPNPDAKYRIEANPGVIEQLPPGVDFQQWNPDHPANASRCSSKPCCGLSLLRWGFPITRSRATSKA
jgi:capsid protein